MIIFDDLIGLNKENLTSKDFHRLFEYLDGELFWKINKKPCYRIGDKAGSFDTRGYGEVRLFNKRYKIYRIIYIMFNGDTLGEQHIDHIDNIRSNNRIENLRIATKSQNQYNKLIGKNNKSGFKGVFWDSRNHKWQARIMVNSKSFYLGLHKTKELAHDAYKKASLELHGEYSNFG